MFLYAEHDKRTQFSVPYFTRARHRLRGPRESGKFNLEIMQFSYSVLYLYEQYKEFQHSFVEQATLLLEGGELPFEDSDENVLNLIGLEDLAARIDQIDKRVRVLEY